MMKKRKNYKRSLEKRLPNIIFGVLLFFGPIYMYFGSNILCYGNIVKPHCVDAYPFNYFFAATMQLFGLLMFIHGILPDKYYKKPVDEQICTQCLRVYYASKAPDWKCPKCGGETENITGFYERHPELKDKEEELPKELETPYKKWR